MIVSARRRRALRRACSVEPNRRLRGRWSHGVWLVVVATLLSGCGALDGVLSDDGAEGDGTEAVAADGSASSETSLAEFDVDVYCEISHQFDQINAGFVAFDDPAALQGFFTSLTTTLNQAVPPPEIADDFVRFRQAYIDLQAQLEVNDYNILVLSQSPIMSDANVNAAITAVDAYDLQTCGVAPAVEAPSTEPAGGEEQASSGDALAEAIAAGDFSILEPLFDSPQLRADFIEGLMGTSSVTEEQAGCFYDTSSIPLLSQMVVDPSALSEEMQQEFLGVLETCGISIDDLTTGG